MDVATFARPGLQQQERQQQEQKQQEQQFDVVDLCESDDAETESLDKNKNASTGVAAAAKRPLIVLLSDDDDDDDDYIDDAESQTGNTGGGAKKQPYKRRRRRRRRRRHEAGQSSGTEANAERLDRGEPTKPPKTTESQLMQLLEVFPDVETAHAKNILRENKFHVPTVLQLLAETNYPKTPTVKQQQHRSQLQLNNDSVSIQLKQSPWKYDYTSPSSFEPDDSYKEQANLLLRQDFKILSRKVIDVQLKLSQFHYYICHNRIRTIFLPTIKDEEEELQNYQTFMRRGRLLLSDEQMVALSQEGLSRKDILLASRRRREKVQVTNEILLEELKFLQSKNQEYHNRMQSFCHRREARAKALKTNSMMECSCCYTETAPEEWVQCKGGDLFCTTCLERHAETCLFANGGNFGVNPKDKTMRAAELLCMAGCGQGFDMDNLKKALSEQLLTKYNEVQCRVALAQAEMDDLVTCPNCSFQAQLPETEMIFCCPVSTCRHESCRKCGEEPHIPFKCSEVESKKATNGRLQVEEAISQAKIRTCPNCRNKFVKELGCNKMRCSCGTLSCYICRAKIKDYSHFCQVAHCDHKTCGGCKLFSVGEEDDELAMKEAGLKAAEAVREKSLSEQSGEIVAVDVDAILKQPSQAPPPFPATAAINAAAPGHHMPGAVNAPAAVPRQHRTRAAAAAAAAVPRHNMPQAAAAMPRHHIPAAAAAAVHRHRVPAAVPRHNAPQAAAAVPRHHRPRAAVPRHNIPQAVRAAAVKVPNWRRR